MATETAPTAITPNPAEHFLRLAYQQGALFHGYILTGMDLNAQYQLAMQTAQLLNCESPVEHAGYPAPCGMCRSCKWITDAAHPSVRVISRHTFEPEDAPARKGERRQISTEQIAALREMLAHQAAPNECRVLIFSDSERQEVPPLPSEKRAFPLPYEWRSQPENEGFTLNWQPITQQLFSGHAANAFLKNLEEPHPRTHYFFLTHQADALLDTIVSRCQTLHVPVLEAPEAKAPALPAPLAEWWTLAQGVSPGLALYQHAQAFEKAAEAAALTPLQALEQLRHYLRGVRAQQFTDAHLYLYWQNGLSHATEALRNYCHPSVTLWHLLNRVRT